MNEFTKDELLVLKMMILQVKHDYPDTKPDCINFIAKIQLLIDNYCEHKNMTQDYAVIDYCDDCGRSGFADE